MAFKPVIGLEVHVQLLTKSKIFSGSPTTFGSGANSQASVIDLGLPGVLPHLNQEVVRMAVQFGCAVKGTINQHCVFARKNYFYPDLPKGYQITQDQFPVVSGGALDIVLEDGSTKTINITRAHLEEDAGKSTHVDDSGVSGMDFNRAGMPLLEIVSEPDLRSPDEAVSYLKTVHALVCYLGICSGNMQEGAFRCDANISLRRSESDPFGTRVELKNINSFRFVKNALQHEVERQSDRLQNHEPIIQETRLYDPTKGVTRSIRMKENANDYRYFPDPDLPPLEISDAFINDIKRSLPELPWEKRKRFVSDFAILLYEASLLTSSRSMASFFEDVVGLTKASPKLVATTMLGSLSAMLNKHSISLEDCPITPPLLAGMLNRIEDETISGKLAKTVFDAMWLGEGTADEIIDKRHLRQITDSTEITRIVNEVIADHPAQLKEFHSGKDKLFGFFVGEVMKASRGKANPSQVNQVLKTKLEESKEQLHEE
jgi:aspartyl-tRNA(Asn)/glutamyl-tRNA(Gln) amidotransferase subunit B